MKLRFRKKKDWILALFKSLLTILHHWRWPWGKTFAHCARVGDFATLPLPIASSRAKQIIGIQKIGHLRRMVHMPKSIIQCTKASIGSCGKRRTWMKTVRLWGASSCQLFCQEGAAHDDSCSLLLNRCNERPENQKIARQDQIYHNPFIHGAHVASKPGIGKHLNWPAVSQGKLTEHVLHLRVWFETSTSASFKSMVTIAVFFQTWTRTNL